MRTRRTAFAALLVAGLALAGTAGSQTHNATAAATASQADATGHSARHQQRFRGRIIQADATEHWFRMRAAAHTVRIHTGTATHWDRCDWSDMDPGQRVDVRAYRQHGAWIASRIQNWHHEDMMH